MVHKEGNDQVQGCPRFWKWHAEERNALLPVGKGRLVYNKGLGCTQILIASSEELICF